MTRISLKTKLLSLFVLVFVCLNAGGAVCLAYCQQNAVLANASEHCPMPKGMPDCPHAKTHSRTSGHLTAATSNTVSCSMLAFNILATTLERKQTVGHADMLTTPVKVLPAARVEAFSNPSSTLDLFGPPGLDRRFDRVKNRVFRI